MILLGYLYLHIFNIIKIHKQCCIILLNIALLDLNRLYNCIVLNWPCPFFLNYRLLQNFAMTNKATVNSLVHIASLVLLVSSHYCLGIISQKHGSGTAIIYLPWPQAICVRITPFPTLCIYTPERELISENKDYHDSICISLSELKLSSFSMFPNVWLSK